MAINKTDVERIWNRYLEHKKAFAVSIRGGLAEPAGRNLCEGKYWVDISCIVMKKLRTREWNCDIAYVMMKGLYRHRLWTLGIDSLQVDFERKGLVKILWEGERC